MIIVGTSGHIDHGKTTLVLKLTGIDTDRLKEEKARGISIELGFAYLDLPGGRRLGLIDVPGHERFVHHMIAGATGVDLVLLVVAADEGIMPQTKEHVAICQLLGMRKGVVVLTKTDLVDPEWAALVEDDIRSYLAPTFLSGAPVLPFSATWEGDRLDKFRDDLYGVLESISAGVSKASADRPFMMPVDRVFSIKGFGTVVTGTVQSGRVLPGDPVTILPEGLPARVRRVEVHGQPAQESAAGTRTAVNLPDIQLGDVQRGDVVAAPGFLKPVTVVCATVEALESLQVPLKGQFKALFHNGAAMAEASVRLLNAKELPAGGHGLAVIRLQAPIALLPGSRHVLRGFTPLAGYGKTLGGGVVLWPGPLKDRDRNLEMLSRLSAAEPAGLLEAAAYLSGANGVPGDALPFLLPIPAGGRLADPDASPGARVRRIHVAAAERFVHSEIFDHACKQVLDVIDAYHAANPRKKGIPKEELKSRLPAYLERDVVVALTEELVRSGTLAADDLAVWKRGFAVNLDDSFLRSVRSVEAVLHKGAMSPPARDALPAETGCTEKELSEVLAFLVAEGKAVKIASDLYFHRDAMENARHMLLDFFKTNPSATTQQLKDLWGLSRKYLIPLAEYFDSIRLTVRTGSAERKLRAVPAHRP